MAVSTATRSFSIEGGDDQIREVWRVNAATGDSIPTILADASVPQIGAAHPDDGTFKVVRPRVLSPRANDERQGFWDLTVTYQRGGGSGFTIGKASTRLLSLGYETVPYEVVAESGYIKSDGSWSGGKVAVLNSAGDPYDPPAMTTVGNVMLRMRQIETSGFSEATAIALQGTINSAEKTVCGYTIPAEKGILREVSPTWNGEQWETEYAIEIELQHPINPEILDKGFRRLVDNKPTEIRYSDLNSEYGAGEAKEEKDKPVSDPELLNGSGGLATRVSGIVTSPVYRQYRFAELSTWTGLSLVSAI